MTTRIALIGYGEVGQILAEDLTASGHVVRAFDVEARTDVRRQMAAHASRYGVTFTESSAAAVRGTNGAADSAANGMENGAELVISAVTASQTVAAAEACAAALPPGCFFLDFNSASPNAKITASKCVGASGGRYVEGAVMSSVPPYRSKVPLLLGGPDANALLPLLDALGFAARVASSELGVASATKMCRSVVIKGLEGLLIESLTAARHYGVDGAVLASLRETFPGIDWEKQAAYFFQRVIEHGRRRSEEMREVAVTVRDAGLEPWSSLATSERQAWMAELAELELFGARGSADFARSADFRTEADRLLAHLNDAEAR